MSNYKNPQCTIRLPKEMIEKLRNMQVSAVDNDMDYEELSKISPKDNLMKVIEDEGIELVSDASVTNGIPALELNNTLVVRSHSTV